MGFFGIDYSKPGPGVDPNEPRKKGVKRFFEILGRDFSGFILLNFFFCLFFFVPFVIFFFTYFFGTVLPPYFFVVSLLTAFPVGGVITTIVFCITKMLRDDPEYVWHDIKKKFPQYFKQGILPGIFYTAYMFGQIFFLERIFTLNTEISIVILAIEAFSLLMIGMIAPYVFLQIAYVDIKLMQIFKNSLFLSIANLPRSIMGAILGNLMWFFLWFLFPLSLYGLPVIMIFGFSITWLLVMMWIWEPVNNQFNIEQTLKERFDKELEEKKSIEEE